MKVIKVCADANHGRNACSTVHIYIYMSVVCWRLVFKVCILLVLIVCVHMLTLGVTHHHHHHHHSSSSLAVTPFRYFDKGDSDEEPDAKKGKLGEEEEEEDDPLEAFMMGIEVCVQWQSGPVGRMVQSDPIPRVSSQSLHSALYGLNFAWCTDHLPSFSPLSSLSLHPSCSTFCSPYLSLHPLLCLLH